MKLLKRMIISLIILVLVTIVTLTALKVYTYNIKERLTIFPLKNFTLIIPEYEDFDYLKVETNPYGDDFYMLFDSELNKLIEYMKENNLVIKPGHYKLNESDRFVKVIKILEFEKKENSQK